MSLHLLFSSTKYFSDNVTHYAHTQILCWCFWIVLMPYGDHLMYNQPVIDATAFLQRPVMWLTLQNHTADTECTTSYKYHFITVTAASPVTGKTILPIANYRVMSGSQSNYWPLEHPLMSVNYIYYLYISIFEQHIPHRFYFPRFFHKAERFQFSVLVKEPYEWFIFHEVAWTGCPIWNRNILHVRGHHRNFNQFQNNTSLYTEFYFIF